MEFALSLKTGDQLSASDLGASAASYRASLAHLLVCPECGEPVHFRRRETPYNTPFFAHYKLADSLKAIHACSLRVFGNTVSPASLAIPGIRHGQLVDRFQKEFCKSLHESFGRNSSRLYAFIEKFDQVLPDDRQFRKLVDEIERLADFQALATSVIDVRDLSWLNEAAEDVCMFLRSSYGRWVGNFVHQVAFFVVEILHPDLPPRLVGRSLYQMGSRHGIFVAEPYRLKTVGSASDSTKALSSRKIQLFPSVAASLIAFLILKWRMPRIAPSLLLLADVLESAPAKKRDVIRQPVKPATTPVRSSEGSQVSANTVGDQRDDFALAGSSPWRPMPDDWWRAVRSAESRAPETHPNISTEQGTASREGPLSPIGDQQSESIPIRHARLFESPRSVSSGDRSRIRQLMLDGMGLSQPRTRLNDRDALLAWSGHRIPFDAYFLAAYLGVAHGAPDFSDPTLHRKLADWLAWAKANH